MTTTVHLDGANLLVRIPRTEIDLIKARSIPQRRFSKPKKAWVIRPSLTNMDFIKTAWPDAEWDHDAELEHFKALALAKQREQIRDGKETIDLSALDGVIFKYPPMQHQMKALLLGRDMPYFAYLMDQGTGKTKVCIDDVAHNWREERVEAMLVISPNSVKTNWVMWECHKDHPDDKDAIEDHMPPDVPYTKGVWMSSPNGKEKAEWKKFEDQINERNRNSLIILSVNIDALNVARCYDFLMEFVTTFKTMIVVDESTRIKKRTSKRTKAAMKLRAHCPLARILSGTPVIKNPMDAFSQFGFLDEDVLGFGNFYSFRNYYCVMGGFKDKQILMFKNLDELADSISSCSYRVTKDECLDLPPQVYLKRRVKLSPAQGKAYAQMVKELYADWGDDRIEAPIVLTQFLRLQEIIGGYLPIIEDGERVGTHTLIEPKNNPKFQEVLDVLDERGDQKFIIWARFIPEIDGMYKLLTDQGLKVERFYGATPERDRIKIRKRFARGELDGIVGNAAAGGIGIDEFKAASLVCRLSNSFDTEERVQSDDRTHRIGSEIHDKITYWDFVVPNTVDVKIMASMRGDVKVSQMLMKDGWKSWI